MNIAELRAERMRSGKSQVAVANEIGCNIHSYRKKESGSVSFSIDEISAITRALNLSAVRFNDIFFDGELPFGN